MYSAAYHGAPEIRRLAERAGTIVQWGEGNPGTHFVAMEEPDALARDIAKFFGALR